LEVSPLGDVGESGLVRRYHHTSFAVVFWQGIALALPPARVVADH
jgi:hypothetical protein